MMISASLGAYRNGTQSAITPLLTAVGPWLEISVYEIGSEGLKAGFINFHFNNGARVIPDINSLRLLREKEGTHGWGEGNARRSESDFVPRNPQFRVCRNYSRFPKRTFFHTEEGFVNSR